MSYKQALYKLNNPNKYIGDPVKLIYKSSWEENVFKLCDNNPNITKWGYEIITIPYIKPLEGTIKGPSARPAKYYPDLYIEYFDRDKNFIKEVLEIKPHKQTKTSRSRKPLTKLRENYTLKVNEAKWAAAQQWCQARQIKFSIITEKSIFKNESNK